MQFSQTFGILLLEVEANCLRLFWWVLKDLKTGMLRMVISGKKHGDVTGERKQKYFYFQFVLSHTSWFFKPSLSILLLLIFRIYFHVSGKAEGETDTERSSICWFQFPNAHRSQELHVGLPDEWQAPKYDLLPPWMRMSRKLVWKESWDSDQALC